MTRHRPRVPVSFRACSEDLTRTVSANSAPSHAQRTAPAESRRSSRAAAPRAQAASAAATRLRDKAAGKTARDRVRQDPPRRGEGRQRRSRRRTLPSRIHQRLAEAERPSTSLVGHQATRPGAGDASHRARSLRLEATGTAPAADKAANQSAAAYCARSFWARRRLRGAAAGQPRRSAPSSARRMGHRNPSPPPPRATRRRFGTSSVDARGGGRGERALRVRAAHIRHDGSDGPRRQETARVGAEGEGGPDRCGGRRTTRRWATRGEGTVLRAKMGATNATGDKIVRGMVEDAAALRVHDGRQGRYYEAAACPGTGPPTWTITRRSPRQRGPDRGAMIPNVRRGRTRSCRTGSSNHGRVARGVLDTKDYIGVSSRR